MSDTLTIQDALVTVGQVVSGRYEITKHLGTGGFAKVFRAFDKTIERDVAIKFLDLRSIQASDDMMRTILERFRREAKLAAKIPHSGVVNIFDIGQLDPEGFRPFIVMELLEGYDLEDQLNDHGALAPARLIPLYVDCLDALGEAHKLGIVHKDLKPSNLFLSNPGERKERLRIVDFGIAHIKNQGADEDAEKPESRQNRLTATGQILGTLQYLTPEYIGSQIVSPALDVYQMALILVELLSGERVIKTDNPFECLRIHTFGLLELPQYLLDSPLGPVLRKALDSEHERRYQDGSEFADALSKVDASVIPMSPLMQGGQKVITQQFQKTNSSPAIPSTNTSNFHKPQTGELLQPTADFPSVDAPSTLAESQQAQSLLDEVRQEQAREQAEDRLGVSAKDQVNRDTVATPEIERPVERNKAGLVIAALFVLGLIAAAVGAIVFLLPPDEKPKEAATAQPVAAIEEPEPDGEVEEVPAAPIEEVKRAPAADVTPPVIAAPDDAPEEQQEEPAPKRRVVKAFEAKVSATPSSASIKVGKRSCGNPCTVEFKRKQSTVAVDVSAPGYEPETVTLKRGGKTSVSVALERVPVKAPPRKPDLSKLDAQRELDRIAEEERAKARARVKPAETKTPAPKKPEPRKPSMGIMD